MRSAGHALCHIGRLVILLGTPALLLAWVVPIDPTCPPDKPPVTEILASRIETLRFHIGLLLGASAAGLLLSRSWRFSVLGALLTLWAILPSLAWPSVERPPRMGSFALRVLSVNLGGPLAGQERVVEEILAANVDVLVLQEYTPEWRSCLSRRLAARFPFRHERVRTDNFGMAVLSRFAWVRLEKLELASSGTPQVRIEFRLEDSPIVLYALHLIPPTTTRYSQHRAEFAHLLRRIGNEEHPTVLVGDFNFVDHSAMAHALHARGFYDAQGLAGCGRGATWPVNDWLRHVPGIRIDHVYLGKGLTSTESWVGGHTGSDHLPIGCEITLADE